MTPHRVRPSSDVLAAESTARDQAWAALRREIGPAADADPATLVADDPVQRLWRTVDAAFGRSVCPRCGASPGGVTGLQRACGASPSNRSVSIFAGLGPLGAMTARPDQRLLATTPPPDLTA